jgi:glycosyltransferase involved in cell wall biosynthesis
MPRLLILCEYPTLLGGERSMLATLNAVAAAGFEVHVAAPPAGPLADELRVLGDTHVPWATHDRDGKRFSLSQLRSDLNGILLRLQPQLLHSNSLSTSRIVGPVAAAKNIVSIGHLRDILRLSPQSIADLNLHRRLIAVSNATRDFHVCQGLDGTKCVVVHNGVDLNVFRPRRPTHFLHRELGIPSANRLIATIGQIGLRKGTDLAIAAARHVASEFPDVHWLIVGERTSQKLEADEFERALRKAATSPPLDGRVHFLGRRTDIAELLSESSLLVHAARQEPLGRVLIEAAACGVAIVATDVGGTREIFPGSAQAAEIVGVNAEEIAFAIQDLLRDAERRRALGTAARRRAEESFDVHTASGRLIEQYYSTLSAAT